MNMENIGKVNIPPKFENSEMVVSAYEKDIKNLMSFGKSFEDAAESVMERNYNPEKALNEQDANSIREALSIMKKNLE